ncbi:hypothetical protein [Actinomadura atramentaria]|uniref:WXG100-like domain-containing protein n=1 Tax=Actinomadura atramentaria TaxID=1990 RepID=UPI000369D978|nr:hypothetical protein [Actinomadura atramentaria]
MGLQLPGELISLLGMLGYNWPEADETKLFQLGGTWMDMASTLHATVSDADAVAQRIWSENKGDDFDAFRTAWSGDEAPTRNLGDAANGCLMVGAGLMVCAGVVLALKINVIVQLTMLAIEIAQAIATAAPTFGASLAEIPIFKEITGAIVDELINQAIGALLDG